MRSDGKWIHTHFDDYGRNIATGFVNQSGILTVSSNQTFSDSLSRTWYDGAGIPGSGNIYNGKVSRGRERILGTNDWIDTRTYYDSYGRVDKTRGNHHLRLTDFSAEITEYTYDFADNVLKEDRDHKYPGGTVLPIINEMNYDHAGRQEDHTISIDGQTEHLSTQTYTVKDELDEKNLGIGTSTVLQSLDYFYFENGFLAGINDNQSVSTRALTADGDWFKMALYYDDKPTGITSAVDNMYNGNISTMIWESGTGDIHAYGFQYDYLDRLKAADLHETTTGASFTATTKRKGAYNYDARGNITSLSRSDNAASFFDVLFYTYSSGTNKLSNVNDLYNNPAGFNDAGGGNYGYDQNGNIVSDPFKDLSISYTYLNLPDTIVPDSGTDSLVFLYTAGGSKLRKKLIETGGNTIQNYIGGIEYTNSTIDAIYHAEGRAVLDGSTWDHEYVITDHLGNTRVRFHDSNGNGTISSGELLSTHDYYPFGLEWNANSYQYTYNGKERNDELGLELFDYGARMYDPAIGNWLHVDWFCCYRYCLWSWWYKISFTKY
jgi:RHS repeat-associated protein